MGVSGNTIREYYELYQQGGIEKLKEINYSKPEGELVRHIVSLEVYFRENPPASIKEAQKEIEEITGVKRSQSQVREFFKKTQSPYRKVGSLPAKADPEKQKEFLEQEMQSRLDEAQAGKRVVLFRDAAHFVLSAFLGCLWSVTRIFIPAPLGRQRFNVLGALNAVTHEMLTVTNDTYITAQSVCVLLERSQLFTSAARLPSSWIMLAIKDVLVMEKAKSLNIELYFLPSYSPNLNLIERVWKFVKKKCLYAHYYEKFPAFKAAISKCLDETMTTHKSI